jgi:homoserine dehydrogenase
VAWAWRSLQETARRNGAQFLHESAVMDGVPIFNLAHQGLRGNRIERLAGILNSTTNFILGAMERGLSMPEALEQARAGGFVEADPSVDLDGWDAAVKITCLANVVMGADLVPESVAREGVRDVSLERVIAARESGRRLKLICEAQRDGDEVHARVDLREIPLSDPFALIEGTSSVLAITADLLGKIVITEQDPDLAATAYGVISDLFALAEARAAAYPAS